METRLLHSISPKPPPSTSPRLFASFARQILFRVRASNSTDENQPPPDPLPLSQIPPSEPLEIRFRRRSRKRRQLREQDLISSAAKQEFSTRTKPEPKKWEEMTVAEKAVELYVGEKGLLFWLNKFAYASIFIVIGGWVLFRFVGPSLNLYQLDTPPLAPQSILKG